ncbi:hypothetical protein DPMN_193319 [Dreissena polymorpha]|uniref:Uncharacterized protein n=1 Tax=Dreissena polymorpha TaxID=45954 RepID=A0A9D4BGR7_DREPO|nr:hypothetical protein DPMN_193319 [Dreissena polymorpha]
MCIHRSGQFWNKANVFSKFYDDWAKIVTSRMFTVYLYSQIRNTPTYIRSNVLQRTGTTFELNQHIIKTNILTKKTAPPTGGHVFNGTGSTFEHNQHIIKRNILTNVYKVFSCIIGTNLVNTTFHEDRTINVASRVFTRKTAPPTGGHVFQRTGSTFELNQHIIKRNILTN